MEKANVCLYIFYARKWHELYVIGNQRNRGTYNGVPAIVKLISL